MTDRNPVYAEIDKVNSKVIRLETQMSTANNHIERIITDIITIKDRISQSPTKEDLEALKKNILQALESRDTQTNDMNKTIVNNLFRVIMWLSIAVVVLSGVRGLGDVWPQLLRGGL